VTCRTIQSRWLLAPRAQVREIVLGVLARAKSEHPVELIAFSFLSSHYHLLIWVEDASGMAAFVGYLNANLAKEIGRLADWKERVWGRRYQSIVVSEEEAEQVARLEYVLANSVKEHLVDQACDWPGAHAAEALLTGTPLEGVWYDRTQEYRYRLRGKEPQRDQFATTYALTLERLPCWRHLSEEEYRERIAEILMRVEEKARAERAERGIEPLGPAAVRAVHPHTRPNRTKKSPAPLFHAASKRAYLELREAYGRFLAAFRDASEKLRSGDRMAVFPEGSFPPALPFVRSS
jgi:REP element-mobilizing transposase RayT